MPASSRRRFVQMTAGFAILGGSAQGQQTTQPAVGIPPNVLTSTSNVERGRWKFVSSASTP